MPFSGSGRPSPATTHSRWLVETNVPADVPAGTLPNTIVVKRGVAVTNVTALTGAGNATTSTNVSGTTCVLNSPANAAVGDVLIAVAMSQYNGTAVTWTPATGWTEVMHTTTGRSIGIFYRVIADASALSGLQSTHTFSTTGATAQRTVGYLFRIRGADLTNPILSPVSTVLTGTTAGVTIPTFTTAAAGAVIGWATTNSTSGASYPAATLTAMSLLASTFVGAFNASNTGNHVFFRQITNGETVHAAEPVSFSPVAAATMQGAQFAIKKA